MIRIISELEFGNVGMVPRDMRMDITEKLGTEGLLHLMFFRIPKNNPRAGYFYVCLFRREFGKEELVEVNDPSYDRVAIKRNITEMMLYKGNNSFVILNKKTLNFKFKKMQLVNYAGICDYTGKIFALGKLASPFMGSGIVGFGIDDLRIRVR